MRILQSNKMIYVCCYCYFQRYFLQDLTREGGTASHDIQFLTIFYTEILKRKVDLRNKGQNMPASINFSSLIFSVEFNLSYSDGMKEKTRE